MSFRGKIFLSVALPAVSLVSIIAFGAYQYVRKQADERADVDVARARGSFDKQLKRQLDNIEQACRPFRNTKFMVNVSQFIDGELPPEDFAKAVEILQGQYFLDFPLCAWADADGKILLRQEEGTRHFCTPQCRHPESAYFGEEAKGILHTEFGLLAARNEFLGEIGQVVVAEHFEEELASIAKTSGTEIAVVCDNALVFSTLKGVDPKVLRGMGEITVGGTPYRYSCLKEGIAVFVPLTSMAARNRQIALIWSGALASIAGAVFISLIVALAVSHSISKPVLELEEASRKIAAGDLNAAVDVRSKDEIGKLGAAFNDMVKGLQERAKRAEIMTKMLSKEVSEKLMDSDLVLGGIKQMASIMFLDVRGFTSLTEGMDPAEAVNIVNQCMTRVAKCISARGGVVNKYLGDGCMALFGVPQSRGNDALNAIEAGRDIQREMTVWNDERKARGEVAVRVGIGINTDEVLAGNVGSADRMEFTVIGEGVNLASRLCSKAQPGQVLASYVTRRDAGVEGKELEPVHVKGFSMPIRIYEV